MNLLAPAAPDRPAPLRLAPAAAGTGDAAPRGRFRRGAGRLALIGVPYGWLLLFFLVPFLIVLRISVSEMDGVAFGDLLSWQDGTLQLRLKLGNYLFLLDDELYLRSYLASLKYAALTTAICLCVGHPFAWFMARSRAALQPALLMAVMLPFWTSFLLRVYAWKGLLSDGGWAAQALSALGLGSAMHAAGWIAVPERYLNTPFSLVLGMSYTYLPFMILPLYGTLSRLDGRLLEAAADLGATPWQAFWRITVPLSRPGIVAGSMLVFIPCVGEFVIPELLGGPETLMVGRVLWDEFFGNNDWPMAASVATVVILLILVPLALFHRAQAQAREGRR